MKYLFILLLTVTAFAFDYPIALQEVALYSGDLAGYWKLQGNADDYSGNGNNGTVVGAVSTGTNYYFDGVDDYINIGDINANSESVSLWFYNENIISKSLTRECVIQLGITDANNYYFISFGAATSTLTDELITVLVKDNTTQYRSGYTSSTATIATGWHHLVVIRSDNSENYYIYLDGVKVNNAAVGTDCPAQLANDVRIAQRSDVDYFDGYIKDVRIYDRALTAEEVGNIYTETLPKHIINLFDSKPIGAMAQDQTYSNLDGTFKNGMGLAKDGTITADFDGVNDYIRCYNFNKQIDYLTLSAWIKIKTPGADDRIFSRRAPSGVQDWILGLRYDANGYIFGIRTTDDVGKSLYFGDGMVYKDTWTHIAVTYGDDGYMRTYINGVAGTPYLHTGEPLKNAVDLCDFGTDRGYIRFFDGEIDNIAIYNTNLSSADITAIYNGGKDAAINTISTNNLVLFYNFNQVPERTLTLQEPTYYYGDLDGWWKLQGNALDYSKNDNDGTVYGAVSTGTNYWFDGVNDYIDCGEIITNGNWTFSAWVCSVDTNKLTQYFVDFDTTYITFGGTHSVAGGKFTFYGAGTVKGTTVLAENKWYLCGLSYSNGTARLYVDGTMEASGTVSANYPSDLIIGKRDTVSALNGYIKDVRIYDRALTAEEINKIYNATK